MKAQGVTHAKQAARVPSILSSRGRNYPLIIIFKATRSKGELTLPIESKDFRPTGTASSAGAVGTVNTHCWMFRCFPVSASR